MDNKRRICKDEETELGCKVGIYASFIFFLNIVNYFLKTVESLCYQVAGICLCNICFRMVWSSVYDKG